MNVFTQRLRRILPLTAIAFAICMGHASAQQRADIKVTGAGTNCTDHLIGAAKAIPGVSAASFNPATSLLNVSFDGGTSVLDISIELSMAGYNAGDFKADPKAKQPECAGTAMRGDALEDDLSDIAGEEDLGNWEDADNLDALERLSNHSDSGITDADLEDDEEDDSDLDGFEDVEDDSEKDDADEEDLN